MHVRLVMGPIALALVLAGCASVDDSSKNPPSGGCGAGPGPTFLATSSGGGFVGPDTLPRLVEIAHNGTIRILQGHVGAGHGDIKEDPPGALHDLTPQDARDMLARRNITLGDSRDMTVTRGDKAQLPGSLFATFCQHLTDALPTLRDEYPNAQRCADEGSVTWDVSLTSAQRHIVVDDCASENDTASFRALQHELDTLVGPG